MGYPAPGKLESIYRNSLTEVRELLEKHHGDHYKVYNLCLESNYRYNADKFHGRVAIFPFEDHNPPTIELIQQFCKDVDSWLKEDVSNVVAVHCKAGKGRTGTMICAYLLYSGLQKSADEALAWYDVKRTKDRKGVTIPSQRRYVQYFSNLVCSSVPYSKKILKICEIRFSESSLLQNLGTVQCTVVVPQDSTTENTPKTWTIDFQESCVLKISNPSLSVAGDIKFEFARKSSQKPFCHFWLNTFFVQNSSVCESDGTLLKCTYTLNKSEIDYVHKDRKHKLFSEDFKISILFEGEACFNDDKKSKKQPAAALETQDISVNQHACNQYLRTYNSW
ncbi:blast:Phosphatidylinositol 3%2C4%2C5-trisphosphate 3-phosphatase and dual-specificity protein [Drosophila guanche]|nr:blast:Phosphatidylinositol 3%2C4%2C5-trisphosphate 3-phosphatase and dual-specificity protein [Drosophila guanche]